MLDVQHTFSVPERDALARDMAAKMTTKSQLDEMLKSISADYKSRIKLIEAEISNIHNKFTVGHEYRPTPVVIHFNKAKDGRGKLASKKGWKAILRKDNGEWVRDEQMTPADFHVEMFDQRKIEEASREAKAKESSHLNSPDVPEGGGVTSTAATA